MHLAGFINKRTCERPQGPRRVRVLAHDSCRSYRTLQGHFTFRIGNLSFFMIKPG